MDKPNHRQVGQDIVYINDTITLVPQHAAAIKASALQDGINITNIGYLKHHIPSSGAPEHNKRIYMGRPHCKLVDDPEQKHRTSDLVLYVTVNTDTCAVTFTFGSDSDKVKEILLDRRDAKRGVVSLGSHQVTQEMLDKHRDADEKAASGKYQKFLDRYTELCNVALPHDAPCPVAKKKKLEIPKYDPKNPGTSAFIAKSAMTHDGPKDNALIIPFFTFVPETTAKTDRDGMVVYKDGDKAKPETVDVGGKIDYTQLQGAQIRALDSDGGSFQSSVAGSTLKRAYHRIQEGRVMPNLGKTPVYLSESYSTALTIAMYRPDAAVYCCAGLGHFLQMIQDIKTMYGTTGMIAVVLDKEKQGDKPQTKQVELEQWLSRTANIKPIALDRRVMAFAKYTDFNDVHVNRGELFMQDLLEGLDQGVIHTPPEVVGRTSKAFEVMRAVDTQPVLVDMENPVRSLVSLDLMGWARADLELDNFYKPSEIQLLLKPEAERDPKAMRKLVGSENEALRIKLQRMSTACRNTERRELGFFKESVGNHTLGYVYNMFTGRFKLEDGKFTRTTAYRPLSDITYLQPSQPASEPDKQVLKNHLTPESFKELRDKITNLYSTDKYTYPILAWLAQAACSSESSFRCHLRASGGSSSGKTNVKRLTEALLPGLYKTATGSTKAGAEQTVNPQKYAMSCPVLVIDEGAGADTQYSKDKMKELYLALRVACDSNQRDRSPKAQGNQQAIFQAAVYSALVTSVTSDFPDAQDVARSAILLFPRLDKTGLGKKIAELSGPRFKEFGELFTKTVCLGFPLFKEAQENMVDRIHKFCEENNPCKSDLLHKHRAITSFVVGLAILLSVIEEIDIEEACEKSFEILKPFIHEQIQLHNEHSANATDLIVRIRNAKPSSRIHPYSDLQTMLRQWSEKQDRWEEMFFNNGVAWFEDKYGRTYIAIGASSQAMQNAARFFKQDIEHGFMVNRKLLLQAMEDGTNRVTKGRITKLRNATAFFIYTGHDLDPVMEDEEDKEDAEETKNEE